MSFLHKRNFDDYLSSNENISNEPKSKQQKIEESVGVDGDEIMVESDQESENENKKDDYDNNNCIKNLSMDEISLLTYEEISQLNDCKPLSIEQIKAFLIKDGIDICKNDDPRVEVVYFNTEQGVGNNEAYQCNEGKGGLWETFHTYMTQPPPVPHIGNGPIAPLPHPATWRVGALLHIGANAQIAGAAPRGAVSLLNFVSTQQVLNMIAGIIANQAPFAQRCKLPNDHRLRCVITVDGSSPFPVFFLNK